MRRMHAMTWVATGTKVCLRVRPLLRLEEDDVNVLRMVRGCVTLKTRSFRRLVNLQAPGLLIKVDRHNKIGGVSKTLPLFTGICRLCLLPDTCLDLTITRATFQVSTAHTQTHTHERRRWLVEALLKEPERYSGTPYWMRGVVQLVTL